MGGVAGAKGDRRGHNLSTRGAAVNSIVGPLDGQILGCEQVKAPALLAAQDRPKDQKERDCQSEQPHRSRRGPEKMPVTLIETFSD